MDENKELGSGLIEQIGEEKGAGKFEFNGEKISVEQNIPSHKEALDIVTSMLLESKLIESFEELEAVGHRVVQGGDIFKEPTLLNPDLALKIKDLSVLAPLHNPAHYAGIDVIFKTHPHVPQVAVFDTSFHQTMPPEAFMYAIPYELYDKYKIRRYGFHGTSHNYVAKEAAKFLGKDINNFNAITFHLGNGASICAIENGKSVDTSMGLTPLAGIMMGTRSGDLDPEVVLYLEKQGMGIKEIGTMLTKQSGLKGVCGYNDLRDVLKNANEGDEKAQLAIEMFAHHNRRFLGSYYAILGRVDAIIFTGGIGENAPVTREKICKNLQALGIEIDHEKNISSDRSARDISSDNASVKALVIPTNEELEIAMQTQEICKK